MYGRGWVRGVAGPYCRKDNDQLVCCTGELSAPIASSRSKCSSGTEELFLISFSLLFVVAMDFQESSEKLTVRSLEIKGCPKGYLACCDIFEVSLSFLTLSSQ